MNRLILSLFIPLLIFSCTQQENSESNIIKSSDWKFGNNAEIVGDSLLVVNHQSTALYNKEYKNFKLKFDCKTTSGAIGGVWFHTSAANSGLPTKGYEVLINNNVEPDEWRKTGSLSAVRNFGKRMADNDEWFPVEVTVAEKNIMVSVNGVLIVDYTEPVNPYRIEKYKDRVLNKGAIAFVSYNQPDIFFRNISIETNISQQENKEAIDEQDDDIIRLQQENFPLIDSHVHLKGIDKKGAAALSRKYGITYGIAPNCGLKFPVTSDQDIYNFLDSMKNQPFFLPMQAEGREWLELFTEEAMSKFDYRFTDALTWTDDKGRRQRIWIEEETFVDDKQKFMDMLVDRAVTIISNEPINIFVNPTFIPDQLMPEYEELWTSERMQRIIDVLVKHNVALEINNRYKIPSARLIKQAKEAGVKFTFGTNNGGADDIGKMEYAIEMIKECKITKDDLLIPLSRNI